MKVIFIGTPDIARVMLEALIENYDVVRVISQPDKRVGRKKEIQFSSVKQCAIDHNIEVLQPNSIKELSDQLALFDVDLIVTCAYGQKIPSAILEKPKFGSINVHASLLPKLRGGAPIHYAIMQGHEESGISIMRMIDRMDAGDVMSQVKVKIEKEDTTGTLYDKLAQAGAKLLIESCKDIFAGNACFVPQDEALATYAPTIKKEDEFISFKRNVIEVYNHIRGLIPNPTGYTLVDDKKVKLHKVDYVLKDHHDELGLIKSLEKDGYHIACEGGYIILSQLQLEGKKAMDAKSFASGSGKDWIGKYFA